MSECVCVRVCGRVCTHMVDRANAIIDLAPVPHERMPHVVNRHLLRPITNVTRNTALPSSRPPTHRMQKDGSITARTSSFNTRKPTVAGFGEVVNSRLLLFIPSLGDRAILARRRGGTTGEIFLAGACTCDRCWSRPLKASARKRQESTQFRCLRMGLAPQAGHPPEASHKREHCA